MKLSLRKIIKQIVFDKIECKTDEMKLYYEYTRYLGVPILQFPKLFYDKDFREGAKLATFATVSRELRAMKSRGEI